MVTIGEIYITVGCVRLHKENESWSMLQTYAWSQFLLYIL